MKIETLKQQLDRDRLMTSVTIRMPEDVSNFHEVRLAK
jgi:hypothetical protein